MTKRNLYEELKVGLEEIRLMYDDPTGVRKALERLGSALEESGDTIKHSRHAIEVDWVRVLEQADLAYEVVLEIQALAETKLK